MIPFIRGCIALTLITINMLFFSIIIFIAALIAKICPDKCHHYMMKQAQKLQQDMLQTKSEIDAKIFPGKYSFVEVEVNGKKEVLKVTIDKEVKLDKEDLEMLQDILVLAVNDALKKVDQETESRMGKYGSGL